MGQSITGVNPNKGKPGQTGLAVTITGSGTNFCQGTDTTTTANFGSNTAVTKNTVNSETELSVTLYIASTATLGPRTVTVSSDCGSSPRLTEGFWVITTITTTLTDIAPGTATPGGTYAFIKMESQGAHPGGIINGMTVRNAGTANPSKLTFKVFKDSNGNGIFEPAKDTTQV